MCSKVTLPIKSRHFQSGSRFTFSYDLHFQLVNVHCDEWRNQNVGNASGSSKWPPRKSGLPANLLKMQNETLNIQLHFFIQGCELYTCLSPNKKIKFWPKTLLRIAFQVCFRSFFLSYLHHFTIKGYKLHTCLSPIEKKSSFDRKPVWFCRSNYLIFASFQAWSLREKQHGSCKK